VVAPIVLRLSPLQQQAPVKSEGRRREDTIPRQPRQPKITIGLALRIGQNGERPLMELLIIRQSLPSIEGYHQNPNASTLKFICECPHLAEMLLTGQSGKMAQQDD